MICHFFARNLAQYFWIIKPSVGCDRILIQLESGLVAHSVQHNVAWIVLKFIRQFPFIPLFPPSLAQYVSAGFWAFVCFHQAYKKEFVVGTPLDSEFTCVFLVSGHRGLLRLPGRSQVPSIHWKYLDFSIVSVMICHLKSFLNHKSRWFHADFWSNGITPQTLGSNEFWINKNVFLDRKPIMFLRKFQGAYGSSTKKKPVFRGLKLTIVANRGSTPHWGWFGARRKWSGWSLYTTDPGRLLYPFWRTDRGVGGFLKCQKWMDLGASNIGEENPARSVWYCWWLKSQTTTWDGAETL